MLQTDFHCSHFVSQAATGSFSREELPVSSQIINVWIPTGTMITASRCYTIVSDNSINELYCNRITHKDLLISYLTPCDMRHTRWQIRQIIF